MNTDDFLAAALRNPVNGAIADELLRLGLRDSWIVSGCLVQSAWNGLTGRAVDYGINDYDVFYFDSDPSWQAEDAVIRDLQGRLSHLGVAIEVRNQARVHLWYPEKHGLPYPALRCSTEGIDRFLTRNTQVGIRRSAHGYDVYGARRSAPIGRRFAPTRWLAWPGRRRCLIYRTTPEINPALCCGGFISFFRKQCASLPT